MADPITEKEQEALSIGEVMNQEQETGGLTSGYMENLAKQREQIQKQRQIQTESRARENYSNLSAQIVGGTEPNAVISPVEPVQPAEANRIKTNESNSQSRIRHGYRGK